VCPDLRLRGVEENESKNLMLACRESHSEKSAVCAVYLPYDLTQRQCALSPGFARGPDSTRWGDVSCSVKNAREK
jgi:hypothetical protein